MKTLLIIEDNKDILDNSSELLELSGYAVLTANNGKQGLEMIGRHKPDLVLCDIMMPVLDGYGVIKAIENLPEMTGIPFIFMTAKAEKEDIRKGMDLGADDYLIKPFSGDDLLRVVAARLKKSGQLKETFSIKMNKDAEPVNTPTVNETDLLNDTRNVKKMRKKHVLFMEGDTCNYLYLVRSGKIKTYKTNEWGKEYITEIYKQNDFFGYTALFTNGIHQQGALAIEDSEVAMIPKEDFFRLMNSSTEASSRFIKILSNGYLEAEQKLLRLAYDSARKRVAEALLFIYRKYVEAGNEKKAFCFQRENISGLAGISPESVSRNLTDFKDEGLIEMENGNILITDPFKLQTIRQ